jgi:hypothetical protein
MTVIHLLNRSLTRSLQGKTPYEAWHERTPAVSYLKTFGCVAYTKDLGQLRKLDDRGKPGVFIGYAEGAKAYRILDPMTQRVKVSRDVIFDGTGPPWTPAARPRQRATSPSSIGSSEEPGEHKVCLQWRAELHHWHPRSRRRARHRRIWGGSDRAQRSSNGARRILEELGRSSEELGRARQHLPLH